MFAADGTSLGYIWSPTSARTVTGPEIPQAAQAGDDRDRGPPLLPARRARLPGHRPRGDQGRLQRRRRLQGASTLTMQLVDNVYLPSQLQVQPRPQVQDRPGQARRAARGQALQELDPQQVPQRRAVRDRRRPDRLRRRRRVADVLRQAGAEADARPGGAARRPAAGAVGVQPVPRHGRRAPAPGRGAAGDGARPTTSPRPRPTRPTAKRLGVKPDNTYLQIRKDPYVFDFIEQQVAQDLCPKTPNSCPTLQPAAG